MEGKISNQQIAARRYIEEQDIEKITSEMLNSLVHEKSKTPIVYMIKYLAGLLTEDERKTHNLVIPEPYPKGKPIVKFPSLPEKSNSLLKKYLTKPVWSTIKYNKTYYSGSIMNLIKLTENDSSHPYGVSLTDSDCLNQYSILLDPIIAELNNLMIKGSTIDKPSYNITNSSAINIESQDYININFPNQNAISSSIKSIKFDYTRNLDGFPFMSIISKEKRESVDKMIKAVITTLSQDEQLFKNGKFYDLIADEEQNIISLLNEYKVDYDGIDKYLTNSCSKSNWPENRSVFISDNREIIILINFKDHFRMIFTQTYINDFLNVFSSSLKLIKKIEKLLPFETNQKYGYVTSCPSNIGSGLEITAELTINNLINVQSFDSIIKSFNFDSFKLEGNSLIIGSRCKLFYQSEYEFLSKFYLKLSGLATIDEGKQIAESVIFSLKEFENESGDTYLTYSECYDDFSTSISPLGRTINSLISNNLEKQEKFYGGFIMKDISEIYFYKELIKNYIKISEKVDVNKRNFTDIQPEYSTLPKSSFTDLRDKSINYMKISIRRNLNGFPLTCSKYCDPDAIKNKIIDYLNKNENYVNLTYSDLKDYNSKLSSFENNQIEENDINSELYRSYLNAKKNKIVFQAEELNSYNKENFICYNTNKRGFITFNYHNIDICLLINDVDHLRLEICLCGNDVNDANLLVILSLLKELNGLNFMFDEKLGFLGSLPKYYGNSIYFMISLNLPALKKDEMLLGIIEKYDIFTYDNKNTDEIELLFKNRNSLTELDSFAKLISCLEELVEAEGLLSNQEQIKE